MNIRIMSFNIRYENDKDGKNVWKNRRELASSILPFHNIDAGGLQEVRKNQLKYLSQRLSDYKWIGVGRKNGKKTGEFCPIFYRKDKLKVLDWNTFWLSENPDIPGSEGWDAFTTRIVTWSKFEEINTGRIFYMYNTHFDHKGKNARIESSYLLLKKIKEISPNKRIIITGDFNDVENSTPYNILTEEVEDAFYKTKNKHHGPRSTLHFFKGLSCKNKDLKRIDFIFVKNGVKVLQHGVLTDRKKDIFPSDHFPVLAEINFDKLY